MLNKVSIMGRLTRDLELKNTQNGHAVVSFSVATDRNYKENNEYPTDFFEVVAWRKTAEFICNHFKKGELIAIDGTLQTRTYTDKDGINRKVVEIVVDSAFFCEKKKDSTNNNVPYGEPPVAHGQPNNENYMPQEFTNIPNDFNPFE